MPHMLIILAIVAIACASLCLWRLFARRPWKNHEREKTCVVTPSPLPALHFCKENGQSWVMPYSRLTAVCYHRADDRDGNATGASGAIGGVEEIRLFYLTREISIRGRNLAPLMEWIHYNRAMRIHETSSAFFPIKGKNGLVVTGIEVGAETGAVDGAAP